MQKFATITDPLHQLLKKAIPWNWRSLHQSVFDNLKRLLFSTTILAYFNPVLCTEVVADAFLVDLGTFILHWQSDEALRPISYASCTFTTVEIRYSQIEYEALAVSFVIQRFQNYFYGISLISQQIINYKENFFLHLTSSYSPSPFYWKIGYKADALQLYSNTKLFLNIWQITYPIQIH